MANDALRPDVAARLREITERIGIEPASRRFDIPSGTIRRALDGGALRRGTRALIEAEIAKVEP